MVVRTELPLGSYSKYSWHITSLLQLKQIFDTPEVNAVMLLYSGLINQYPYFQPLFTSAGRLFTIDFYIQCIEIDIYHKDNTLLR